MSPTPDSSPADKAPDQQPLAAPLTELAAAAIQQHELFMAYVQAGFTRSEALQLLIELFIAGRPPQ